MGGALGNRQLEVEAHAHRQLWEGAAEVVAEDGSRQLAQGAEVGTRRLGIVAERRDRHQAEQLKWVMAEDPSREDPRVLGQHAGFLRASRADVDLHEHALPPPRPVPLEEELQPLGDLGPVHGVDDVEARERGPRLGCAAGAR